MPDTAVNNLNVVMASIKEFYAANRLTNEGFNKITIGMFTSTTDHLSVKPKLKGRAAEMKTLCKGAMVAIWEKFKKRNDVIHDKISLCLTYFATIEKIMETQKNTFKFPDDDYQRFKHATLSFCLTYNSIGNHFMTIDKKLLFNVTVKLHYFAHMALQAKYCNPRLTWCYSAESYMFNTRRLMQSCIVRNTPWGAQSKFSRHYRLAQHLHWENMNVESA